VRSKVVEGHPLADGLRDFPQAFPEIYRATVSAGEQSGKLDSVLERLSDYTESRQVMGQQVSNALVYPIVLMVLSFAIVSFLLAYVVPQVVAVFESGHQELPIATRILIGMSDLIRHYWFYGVIVIAAGTWGFLRWLKAPEARLKFDRFMLRVPLVGKLIRGLNTARFSRTFSILTASAVPVLEALRISAEVVNSMPMKRAVEDAALRVREGAPIGKSLAARKLFPPHDDSPHQQRREQRRAGKDARAGRDEPGTRDGRPALDHDQSPGALHGGIHGRGGHVHRHRAPVADFSTQRPCQIRDCAAGYCA
jgi:general secretion pathway protein F